MQIGQVYFNVPRPGLPKHAWVIATHPDRAKAVLIVNWSSDPGPEDDRTCLLPAGCHRTVVRPSYVRYKEARVVEVDHLRYLIREGLFTRSADLEATYLVEIQKGFLRSPHAKMQCRQILESQGLPEEPEEEVAAE